MTGTTISGSSVGVTLTNPTYNPVYVTGTIADSAGTALYGASPIVWTVINSGLITDAGFGIYLNAGGAVTNQSGGTITGGDIGLRIDHALGTVINAGDIGGSTIDGVNLYWSGAVTNESGGIITGGLNGVAVFSGGGTLLAAGTVTNVGTIEGFGGSGVFLDLGGAITNQIGGALIGGQSGVQISGAAGTVVNAGDIAGSGASSYLFGDDGVFLYDGGTVLNQDGGVISGATDGLRVLGSAGAVINASTIIGLAANGVNLSAGGAVTNQSGGTITGSEGGIRVGDNYFHGGAAGTVTNAGDIAGFTGVILYGGGYVSNQSGGTVAGEHAGVFNVDAAGAVVNAGVITGTNAVGVNMRDGGAVINQSGGTINGAGGISDLYGTLIVINAGDITGSSASGVSAVFGNLTVINAGVISGDGHAVLFDAYGTNNLIIDPGAVFIGLVDGGNAVGSTHVSRLDLASGASDGTLTALGSQYFDFANITIDVGATWTLVSDALGAGYTIDDIGTLTNTGSLGSTLVLELGAYLSNAATGIITGTGIDGVYGFVGSTVVNAGVIDPPAYGVFLFGDSTAINLSGGSIEGTTAGVEIFGSGGVVINAGSLSGTSKAGVWLVGGGYVTNQSGGVITGYRAIFAAGGVGKVFNAGYIGSSIIAGSGHAVELDAGGKVINQADGTISAEGGAAIDGSLAPTVVNFGMIADLGEGVGVVLSNGGGVINQAGGAIIGVEDGIDALGGTGTVFNGGGITATGRGYYGIKLLAGGYIDNLAGGTIIGSYGVSVHGGAGTLVNAGYISGANTGVILVSGASLTNLATGTIFSPQEGMFLSGSGTLTNAGNIVGIDAVLMVGGYSGDRLIIDPGASFGGLVDGGNPAVSTLVSTLELASGSSAGTLTGLGSQFFNFAHIAIDSGANWGLVSDALGQYYEVYDRGTLTNGGSIGDGVVLYPGATLINQASAVLGGIPGVAGVYERHGSVASLAAVVANYGTIIQTPGTFVPPPPSDGIVLYSSEHYGVSLADASVTNHTGGLINGETGIRFITGYVTNQSGGIIMGYRAIVATGGGGTVVNAGYIGSSSIAGRAYAIQLEAGGTVINQASGTISAEGGAAIDGSLVPMVMNFGLIADAVGGVGVVLSNGGNVTNEAVGTIVGVDDGVDVRGGAGTVVNGGSITATGRGYYGIKLLDGGYVNNLAGGTISGSYGVYVRGGAGTVVNAGSIGGGSFAVMLQGGYANRLVLYPGASFGSTVTGGNAPGSSIASTLELASGATTGTLSGLGTQFIDFTQVTLDVGSSWVFAGADTLPSGGTFFVAASLGNTGTIAGNLTLGVGAYLSNAATGTIVGAGIDGIYGGLGSTVVNAGLIDPPAYGIHLAGGSVTNQSSGTIIGNFGGVRIDNGAGTVDNAGDIVSTSGFGIYLGDGGGVTNQSGGTITGGNDGIRVSGAVGTVTNAGTINAGVAAVSFQTGYANRLVVDPGGVFIGSVNGGNPIGSSIVSTLELASAASAGTLSGVGTQFIDFDQTTIDAGAAWTLQFPAPGSTQGSISGFAVGDKLDLAGIDPVSVSLAAGTLTFAGGSFPLSLAGTAGVQATSDGSGGALVTVACFREGTRIRTPRGDVLVEDLRIGDDAVTLRGSAPIIWIGHRSIDCCRHPKPRNAWPVRIAKDAFGDGQPCNDLFLSPDHAVFANDVLIPVKHLINGTTIEQIPVEQVMYYHVELVRHGVLLADGLPVESYLNTGHWTDLVAEYVATLHADFASRLWEATGCAPLFVSGPVVIAARRRLEECAKDRRIAA